MNIYLKVRKDERFLNFFPDDACHFISIKLDNRTSNFNALASCI